jgi:hypothetical protein
VLLKAAKDIEYQTLTLFCAVPPLATFNLNLNPAVRFVVVEEVVDVVEEVDVLVVLVDVLVVEVVVDVELVVVVVV